MSKEFKSSTPWLEAIIASQTKELKKKKKKTKTKIGQFKKNTLNFTKPPAARHQTSWDFHSRWYGIKGWSGDRWQMTQDWGHMRVFKFLSSLDYLVLVLLSTYVERFSISCMWDLFNNSLCTAFLFYNFAVKSWLVECMVPQSLAMFSSIQGMNSDTYETWSLACLL